MRLLLVLACFTACERAADRKVAEKLFKEISLDAAPGLSGLTSDNTGALWTVAERADTAYRMVLDAEDQPALEKLSIDTPSGLDLEGIAWLGGGRFALGTEGREAGVATVLIAERRDDQLAITSTIKLPASRIGIELPANHGAEGVCGAGDTILVAIEGSGMHGGKRFAPIVRIVGGEIVRTHRLWLTTATGKISGLDCTLDADGVAKVIAIERHFEVTNILELTVPNADGDITPTVALNLGSILNGRLNLEGVARANDRVYAIVDNQWKMITGASLLLAFEPTAIR